MKNIEIIKKKIKGSLKEDVSLKAYNTWKIGGNAEYFFEPKNLEDLKTFLKNTTGYDITFLGNGSNVLIRDGGIKGFVVCLKNSLNNYYKVSDNEFIFEAGLSCMKIAQITSINNSTGLEFLCGIPGSLGGALRMNAGCYGGNIWENLKTVTLIDKSGNEIKKYKEDFNINYRNVELDDNLFFINASFSLKKNELNNSSEIIKDYLKDRRSKQPTSLPSCGSVFKNPENSHAANLIESVGLKEYKIGGAYVSKKHANFIISDKTTKSKDIEDLIGYIQTEVYKKKKVFLETEVKFIGIDL
ncbi:MAG: UDP-N-acetylmuramate dehydrogenase [Gammaproteobacteria bacterium]